MEVPRLHPDLELLEMQLARRRRRRVLAVIAAVVVVALVLLTVLSQVVRLSPRPQVPTPTTEVVLDA